MKTNYTVGDAALEKLWTLGFTLLRGRERESMEEHKEIEEPSVTGSVQKNFYNEENLFFFFLKRKTIQG